MTDTATGPDTVRAAWDLFAATVLRPESTPTQRQAAQVTFYAGALALLRMMDAAGRDRPGTPLEQAVAAAARVVEWAVELNEFIRECNRRAAEVN